VRELEQFWHSMLDAVNKPTISVDLTGVTYIDAAGKAQLADMHEQGAQFIAEDCMTKAVVEELVGHEPRQRTRIQP
jgi:ABC-type transporter Mla MlaB component